MRTKHLLMTMALPLAFAACTSDEFETSQSGPVDLSGRKALGDVTLTFNGDEANTRLEIGQSGIGFSTVDGVGACLVDQPNANYGNEKKDVIEWYGLNDKNYISSNYLYKTADGGTNWTTDARMVEGNYVFYAPHNESHLERTPLAAEFPNPQIITIKDGAPYQYSAIQQLIDTKAPMYVGYKFLDSKAQTKNISVAMKPIYSYPKITLKNTFGIGDKVTSATKDLTIRRIILLSDANFDQKTTLKVGATNVVASKSATGVVGSLFNYGSDAKKYGTWASSDRLFDCPSSDILTVADKGTTGAITLDFATPYVLGKDKSLSINAVVPAAEYTNLTVGIYTNEGYFEKVIEDNTLNLIPGRMYPQEEYMENGELNQSVKGSNLTVEMTEVAEQRGEIVSTTDELANLVKTGKGNLTVMPLNADVAYSAKVAEYMLQGGVQSITFTAPVTVDNATVIKKLIFNKDVTVKGNVEFKNAEISWGANTVTVKEGATLKMTSYASDADGKISPEAGATVELAATIPAIDADAEGLLKFNETVTLPAAFTAYAGNIEIAKGKTVTLAAALATKGNVTNYGTLAMSTYNLTNKGTFTNESTGMVKGTGAITNNGTFTNKNIVDATFANAGTYTSAANKVVATLKVEKGAVMNKAVTNTTTSNAANDKLVNIIEVANGAYFNGNDAAIANGTVQYIINGNVTSNPSVPAVCNKLVINGNVVASSDNLNVATTADIEINGNINAIGKTITFSASTNVVVSDKVYASGGTVTFTAATNLEFGSVEANANVVLTKATAVKLNGDITLEGAATEMTFTEAATVTIAANSTLTGGGKMNFKEASTIKVLADVTFKSMSSVITGADGKTVTIESPAATTAGDANPGKVQGQVVNYGTITWATAAYAEGETYPWWTGNAAKETAS